LGARASRFGNKMKIAGVCTHFLLVSFALEILLVRLQIIASFFASKRMDFDGIRITFVT